MPTPQESQLQRMCAKPETIARAKALLVTVSARTGPGSGHDVGRGATGLVAICAYIASEQLANDDVSEKTAQTASCLAPKVFKNTLAIAKNVVSQSTSSVNSDEETPRRRRSSRHNDVTYSYLLETHKVLLASTVSGWLEATERVLDSTSEFRASYEADSSLVKCTVFHWVCQILGLARITQMMLHDRYSVDVSAFEELHALLEEHGTTLKGKIQTEIESLRKKKKAGPKKANMSAQIARRDAVSSSEDVGLPSPSTALSSAPSETESELDDQVPVPSSPRKSALKRPAPLDGPLTPRRAVKFLSTTSVQLDLETDPDDVDRPVSPTKIPRAFPNAPASESMDPDMTPSRRSSRILSTKVADSTSTQRSQSAQRSPSKSPSKASRRNTPSSSPSSEETESEDEDSIGLSQRYRPILADRQQWLARDLRAEREWAEVKRAAVKAEEIWGHPFEVFRPRPDHDMDIDV